MEVHAKWFVANTSCIPTPLAIGPTNPPGSFLQGKACIKMPRQRWSLALVASPQKGCGKSFVQCSIVRWYEMFGCFSCLMDELCENVIFTWVGQQWLRTSMDVLRVENHKTSQCVFCWLSLYMIMIHIINYDDWRSHDYPASKNPKCRESCWLLQLACGNKRRLMPQGREEARLIQEEDRRGDHVEIEKHSRACRPCWQMLKDKMLFLAVVSHEELSE